VQDAQTPAVHTWPRSQSLFALQAGVQMPATHASPDAQSLVTEHAHWIVVWVAMHAALGPHWASVVHSAHDPLAHT
jgi:hypothetical protein